MSAPLASWVSPSREQLFAESPRNAAEHFCLSLFGVIAQVIESCAGGDRAAALDAYPFLADYADLISERLGREDSGAAEWRRALELWERTVAGGLPLRLLLEAGLSRVEIELVLAAGLIEEDPRFAEVFERATGRERRPTAGLLLAWWRGDDAGRDRPEEVRRLILGLVRSGLLQVLNPEAPRSEWVLAVAPPLWDALRGEALELSWLRHLPREELLPPDRYIAPPAVSRICCQLPLLLAAQPAQTVVVRGPRRNGRRTLLGAVASALGKGILVATGTAFEDEPKWRIFGALAAALNAVPVFELALMPGETRVLPRLPLVAGTIGVVAGLCGGIHAEDSRPMLTVELPLPDADCRRQHWRAAAPAQNPATLEDLAQSVRLTSGNIRRAADAAEGYARLDGREHIGFVDVRLACRGLNTARLETLATRIEAHGSLFDLALDDYTRSELESLAARCRHREALAVLAPYGPGGGAQASGVRALFGGPSGTGKTLAAKLLAATLAKDLFRVDLAATVNKYLGETEKNLEQAFAAAEELDVVLLLDEGDALMAPRTDVGSSNDRYANLETNFLLQRIETFAGILLVTSNAADRIDRAFARRMDVVIHFRAPDEISRYQILRLHLGTHAVDDKWLQEAACRCVLTGGQLRNIVLHAQLLSLQCSRPLDAAHLHAALLREYRKTGAHCPLTPPACFGAGS